MQKTLLRPLFLLLLSLQGSLFAMENIDAKSIVAGCKQLEKSFEKQRKEIENLKTSLKSGHIIELTNFDDAGVAIETIAVNPDNNHYKDAVGLCQGYLDFQHSILKGSCEIIDHLYSSKLGYDGAFYSQERGDANVDRPEVFLNGMRTCYKQLLEVVEASKNKQKKYAIKVIPAASSSN